MSSANLENLARIGKLKREAPDAREFAGLLHSGRVRLADAQHPNLSIESRFDLAYNAAHALSLAALRFHARFYVHGHRVGGTNPSLVEALGAGNAVLAPSLTLPRMRGRGGRWAGLPVMQACISGMRPSASAGRGGCWGRGTSPLPWPSPACGRGGVTLSPALPRRGGGG